MDRNRVQRIGRLVQEPLLWQAGDHPVATLALACRWSWHTADGQMYAVTKSSQLTAWEELAEWCGRVLRAGDRIYAEGRRCVAADGRHAIVIDRIVLLARPTPPAASAAVAIARPAA